VTGARRSGYFGAGRITTWLTWDWYALSVEPPLRPTLLHRHGQLPVLFHVRGSAERQYQAVARFESQIRERAAGSGLPVTQSKTISFAGGAAVRPNPKVCGFSQSVLATTA